jgi:hypothetical protein
MPLPLAPPRPSRDARLRALVLSAVVCPGLGQLALGRRAKGLALVATSLAAAIVVATSLARELLGRLATAADALEPQALAELVAEARRAVAGPVALGTAVLLLAWAYAAWDAWSGSA